MIISKKNAQILKRILQLIKPYGKKMVIVLACTLSMAIVRVIYPLFSKWLIDEGLTKKNFELVVKICLAALLLVLIEQCFSAVEAKYRIYICNMLSFTLAKRALKKLFRLKLNFFNNTKIGDIINNINNDVQNVSAISNQQIFSIVTIVFNIAGGLTGLAIINWKLAILAILLIPLKFLLVRYLTKIKRGLFEKIMGEYQSFWGWYSDIIGGIKEIKLWSIMHAMLGVFVKKQRELINLNAKIASLDKVNEISDVVISETIIRILYLAGAVLIFNESLTIGGLIAFITYMNYVASPFFYLTELGGYIFSTILPSAERLFNFLDMETEGRVPGQNCIRIDTGTIEGRITFENVSFSFDNEKILDNVSFEIRKGEKIALTGANGSGKTTIINLILRFYNPDSGRILLDGTDISSINLRDYRKCISVICQDIYLFDASIKDNITLFKETGDSVLFDAARKSGAEEFINKVNGKYEALIGRNGSQISGGERQKIAVARAFAKRAPILIMDEATSNFDAESDTIINRMLEKEFDNVTVIAISHKPEIFNKVDRVITLDKGKIEIKVNCL